jgi:hypothetical protein
MPIASSSDRRRNKSRKGGLNLAQDVSPGLDFERTTSPAGTAVRYVHPIVGRELKHGVGFALHVLKSVPQRLKPSSKHASYGTAEAVPFVRQSLPQPLRVSEASGAVQIGHLKNLI